MPGRVRETRHSGSDHGSIRLRTVAKAGEYTPEDRTDIAERARRFLAGGRDLFVFFKHEDDPAGALYAEELLKAAGEAGVAA